MNGLQKYGYDYGKTTSKGILLIFSGFIGILFRLFQDLWMCSPAVADLGGAVGGNCPLS